MGKTFSSDRAHQKRHFVRQNKDRYADETKSSELNIFDVIERSFKVDAVRYGNHRKWKANEKVEQRRSDRRKFKQYEDE